MSSLFFSFLKLLHVLNISFIQTILHYTSHRLTFFFVSEFDGMYFSILHFITKLVSFLSDSDFHVFIFLSLSLLLTLFPSFLNLIFMYLLLFVLASVRSPNFSQTLVFLRFWNCWIVFYYPRLYYSPSFLSFWFWFSCIYSSSF